MTARIVDCENPSCLGKAEFMPRANIYMCPVCGGRYQPNSIKATLSFSDNMNFHGRLRERALLEALADQAKKERPQVVLIHGEPGIGKTALMSTLYHVLASSVNDPNEYWPDIVGELVQLSAYNEELCNSRRGKDAPFLWLAGQAPEPNSATCTSLLPWERAFEGLRNIPLGASGVSKATGVAKAVGKSLLGVGADLLGIGLIKNLLETSVEVGIALKGRDDAFQTFALVGEDMAKALEKDITNVVGLLANRTSVPLLVISLDDLQWADPATCSSIVSCCRASIPGWRLLLILGYRDNEVSVGKCPFADILPVLHRYANNNTYNLIDLPILELDMVSSEALVRDHFKSPDSDLLKWLVQEIGGAPFYLHQFCQMLKIRGDVIEPGVIKAPGGISALRNAIAQGVLPVKLEAILQERFDKLAESQRRLLAYGSVEGRTFTDIFLQRVLSRMSGEFTHKDNIRQNLSDCEQIHHLIRSALEATPHGWSFEFLHELLHITAGHQLSHAVRASCLESLKDWLLDIWESQQFEQFPLPERRKILDRLIEIFPISKIEKTGISISKFVQLYLYAGNIHLKVTGIEKAVELLKTIINYLDGHDIEIDLRTKSITYTNFGIMMKYQGNFNEAKIYFCKALSIFEHLALNLTDSQAQNDLGTINDYLGLLMQQTGKMKEAEEFYRKALASYKQMDQLDSNLDAQRGISSVFNHLGYLLQYFGKLDEAEDFYQKSIYINEHFPEEGRDQDLRESLSSTYNNLSELLSKKGKLDEAKNLCDKSLEILNSLGQDTNDIQHQKNLITIFNNLSFLMLIQRNQIEAEKYINQALSLSDCLIHHSSDTQSQGILWNTYINFGDLLQQQGKMKEAEAYYRKAVDINERLAINAIDINVQRMFASTYSKLAHVFQLQGNLSKGEELFRKVLFIEEQFATDKNISQDLISLSAAYNNIGSILMQQGKIKEAEDFLHKSLEISEGLFETNSISIEAQKELCVGYNNIGYFLLQNNKLKESVVYLNHALKFIEKLMNNVNDASAKKILRVSYSSLGRAMQLMGNFDRSEKLFREAFNISERFTQIECNIQNKKDLIFDCLSLGNVLHQLNNFDEAEKEYRKALLLCERLVYKTNDLETQNNLIYLYSILGDLMLQQNKLKEAEEFYRKDLGLCESRVKNAHDNHIQKEICLIYSKLGSLLQKQGNIKEAEKAFQKITNFQECLAKDLNDFQYQGILAVAYANLGLIKHQQKKLNEAEIEYQKSLLLCEYMVREANNNENKNNLATIYSNLGDLKWEQKENLGAYEFYQKGLEISESIAKDLKDIPAQRKLGYCYIKLSALTHQLGKIKESKTFKKKAGNIQKRLVQYGE